MSMDAVYNTLREELRRELSLQSEHCIECKLCRNECDFLRNFASPKQIADTFDPISKGALLKPFECSLCGLCGAVCPVGINPADMFLEMRREAVSREVQDFSKHSIILGYEKRGASRRFSWYSLPDRCDTVFFPGCALPGTRPKRVQQLFHHLQETIPTLGIVLDCCTKPSHDLGRDNHFQTLFQEMRNYLIQQGVQKILVACPNCYRIFREYGDPLQVETVYEHLDRTILPDRSGPPATVTIHDPCGTRNAEQVHAALRSLAEKMNLTVQEMKHHGTQTLCCGEGGSAGYVRQDYARAWSRKRSREAGGTRMLTYCAGCTHFLGGLNPTSHILDLLFEPEATLAGRVKVAGSPWTYFNRLRLKRYFKKRLRGAVRREREGT